MSSIQIKIDDIPWISSIPLEQRYNELIKIINFGRTLIEYAQVSINPETSIILPLIEKAGFVEGIEMLQGTFGCWYYNARDATLKIFRSGSTLFINRDHSSFTSASQTDYKLVNEGEILEYNFTSRKFYKSDTFKLNSVPFFL